MTRQNELRKQRGAYTVAWREFLIGVVRDESTVFCFFEGEDSKYYAAPIRLVFSASTKFHFAQCNGKDGLIRLFTLWNENGYSATSRALFFVDRDFDSRSRIHHCNVYVTKSYSIENSYVSADAILRVLESEFVNDAVDESTEHDMSVAITLYRELLDQYLSSCAELMAWIFLQRKHRECNLNSSRVNLSAIQFDNLFRVTRSGVIPLYNLASLESWFPNASPINVHDLQRYTEWFSRSVLVCISRGKYLMDFARKVLVILKEDRCSASCSIFSKKVRVKIQLSRDNLISELSQYADTPIELRAFLSHWAANYK